MILKVEIADTPELLMKGLMFRKDLPEDRGMAFIFPVAHYCSFWGKNTYLPLDIAFVSPDRRILCIKEIIPHSTKLVNSNDISDLAIETNSGFFAKHNIKPGDKIKLTRNGDSGIIEFFQGS